MVNNPTNLVREVQVIMRRRININKLLAVDESVYDARISLDITANEEQVRLIKTQLDKLIDVIQVN